MRHYEALNKAANRTPLVSISAIAFASFFFLQLMQWTHSHLYIPWLGGFHGAMSLGGGCGRLEMS